MTCDYKVFDLNDDNHHIKNDILRCFHVGGLSGSRGSWAIEHTNNGIKAYVRKMNWMRDQLTKQMLTAIHLWT